MTLLSMITYDMYYDVYIYIHMNTYICPSNLCYDLKDINVWKYIIDAMPLEITAQFFSSNYLRQIDNRNK